MKIQISAVALLFVLFALPMTAGTVQVTVTKGGSPLKGAEIVLTYPNPNTDRGTQHGTSDAEGKVKFESVSSGTYTVYTKREFEWMRGDGKQLYRQGRTKRIGELLRFDLSADNDHSCELALDDPERIWVTVDFGKKDDREIRHASVLRFGGGYEQYGSLATSGMMIPDDGHLVLGPMRAGEYEIVAGDSHRSNSFYARIHVDKPGEQNFELDVNRYKLKVKFKRPSAFKGVNAYFSLSPYYWPRSHVMNLSTFSMSKTEMLRDTVEFSGVYAGTYYVSVWSKIDDPKRGQSPTVSCADVVEVTKNGSVTLKPSSKVGEIRVAVPAISDSKSYGDLKSNRTYQAWIEILDKKGQPVSVGGVSRWRHEGGEFSTVPGVEQGTYKIRLSGGGWETTTSKSIKVKKNETVTVTVDVKKCQTVRLQASNLAPGALLLKQVAYEVFDKDGNAIPIERVGLTEDVLKPMVTKFSKAAEKDVFGDETGPVACELRFVNVPENGVKIRVTAEGYQAVEFDIKPVEKGKRYSENTVEFKKAE